MHKVRTASNSQASLDAFWLKSMPRLLSELRSDPTGLTGSDARSRLQEYGPNVLQAKQKRALFVEFMTHFNNPLILILLGACFVSLATGDATSFVIIIAMVVMSVALDFVQ